MTTNDQMPRYHVLSASTSGPENGYDVARLDPDLPAALVKAVLTRLAAERADFDQDNTIWWTDPDGVVLYYDGHLGDWTTDNLFDAMDD